ncbi:hypothetical protein M407DRAFT_220653 [Tulasnella calospora MUT 4182]|uniref:Uncharacterized protein n=1 Tax=Tulasnella calospora MUT 4182 TaxID=1051891 RepID=A0A0C3PYP1_9AGAM|nr:hypothetical protein M407DRAFT_220653 [Tulasnella calospora MUT 4182]
MYNKAREARAASAVIIDTTPSTPTPTAHQLARAAFKERQAAERARSFKTWDQMSDRGNRNGKSLPKAFARVEARVAERAAKTGHNARAPLDASVDNFDGDEQYMAPTARAEINLLDIMQPARGKSARGELDLSSLSCLFRDTERSRFATAAFASESARHPNSIPYPLLVPGSSLSLDDYLFEDSIPAELIAELFPTDEAVPAPRREAPVDVDSDRTDEEDNDDALPRENDDEEQWELATVGASEFSFVSVTG